MRCTTTSSGRLFLMCCNSARLGQESNRRQAQDVKTRFHSRAAVTQHRWPAWSRCSDSPWSVVVLGANKPFLLPASMALRAWSGVAVEGALCRKAA